MILLFKELFRQKSKIKLRGALAIAEGQRYHGTAKIRLNLLPEEKLQANFPEWASSSEWTITIFHELMHHSAGVYRFDDQQLALATADHLKVKPPDFDDIEDEGERALAYSKWWDTHLRDKCGEK